MAIPISRIVAIRGVGEGLSKGRINPGSRGVAIFDNWCEF